MTTSTHTTPAHATLPLSQKSYAGWIAGFVAAALLHSIIVLLAIYEQPPRFEPSGGAPEIIELAEVVAAPSYAANQPQSKTETSTETSPEQAQTNPSLSAPSEPTTPNAASTGLTEPVTNPQPSETTPPIHPTVKPKQVKQASKGETHNIITDSDSLPKPQSEVSASASQIAQISTTNQSNTGQNHRISNSHKSWQGQLVAHLERHKRYPYEARARRQEGDVLLRFTMNSQGGIIEAELAESSGHFFLDQEVKAMLLRAQPLPSPPEELLRKELELVIPIRFALR